MNKLALRIETDTQSIQWDSESVYKLEEGDVASDYDEKTYVWDGEAKEFVYIDEQETEEVEETSEPVKKRRTLEEVADIESWRSPYSVPETPSDDVDSQETQENHSGFIVPETPTWYDTDDEL